MTFYRDHAPYAFIIDYVYGDKCVGRHEPCVQRPRTARGLCGTHAHRHDSASRHRHSLAPAMTLSPLSEVFRSPRALGTRQNRTMSDTKAPQPTTDDLLQEATGEGHDPDFVWEDEPDFMDPSEVDDPQDRGHSETAVE